MKNGPAVIALSALLTFLCLFLYGDARLAAAVICCAALCALPCLFHRRWRSGRLFAGTAALMGYTALYAASCLYGPYGTEGLPGAASLLIGTAACLLLTGFGGEKTAGRLLTALSLSSGAAAFLSLDAASAQAVTPWLLEPLLSLSGGPGLEEMGYEAGKRIIGVAGGANVLAGLLGVGTLLGLYGFLHAGKGRERAAAAILLLLSASVFFMAFSLGALCAFAAAALIGLLCTPREERGRLFRCMALTAVLTLACAAAAFGGLGGAGSVRGAVSLLCPFFFGAVLAEAFPRAETAAAKLSKRGRRIAAGCAGGAAAVYLLLALLVRTPLALTPWPAERDAALGPGAYTLTLTADAPVKVTIASQDRAELLDGEYRYLYDGTALQIPFTVPEGAGIVRFSFAGSGSLRAAAYSGAETGTLRLTSPLVPSFVTNRLEGLFFSKNVLERLEMCRDGLKLAAVSPVFGRGAGAFEEKAYSVQQHYYVSKYVHNQYVQCLVDTGIAGLALFLAALGGALWQVRRGRKENPSLAAALTACLTMAAVHGCTEVVWSVHAYVIYLLCLLALCGTAFSMPEAKKRRPLWIWAERGYAAAAALFAAAVVLHLGVGAEYRRVTQSAATPEKIAELCRREPFSREIYQLDYVCNYGAGAERSGEYLEALRKRGAYDVNLLLLQYVYLPAGDEENIRSAVREAYWDRRCDKEAVAALYHLLEEYGAEKLFTEGNG